MGDNRPARYVDPDGSIIYRASSLGSCERALVAHARGLTPMPHPEWFQEVLDEGTQFEDEIRRMWARDPLSVASAEYKFVDQVELELKVMDGPGRGVIVRSHTDDLAIHGNQAILREYKKFRPSTWQKFVSQGVECNQNYPWQVSAMWHALLQQGCDDITCEFVGGQLSEAGGVLLHVEPKILHTPPIPLKAIIKKVGKVEALIDEGYDPSEVPCTKQYPCGFWKLHDPEPEVEVHQVADGDEAQAWAAWHTEQQIVKTAEQMLKAAKERRQRAMDALVAAAPNAKKFERDGAVLTRITSHVPEKTRTVAAYDTDYLKISKRKDQEDG